nr:hypothetical protein [Glycomyces sp. YM15]
MEGDAVGDVRVLEDDLDELALLGADLRARRDTVEGVAVHLAAGGEREAPAFGGEGGAHVRFGSSGTVSSSTGTVSPPPPGDPPPWSWPPMSATE